MKTWIFWILLSTAVLASCGTEPDEEISELEQAKQRAAREFIGLFRTADGTEIELTPRNNGGYAVVKKHGSTSSVLPAVGEEYIMGAGTNQSDRDYRGLVWTQSMGHQHARVRVTSEGLEIEWKEHVYAKKVPEPIPGHDSWKRLDAAPPGTGGNSGGGVNCDKAWTCANDGQATPMCSWACAHSGTERQQTCSVLRGMLESGNPGQCCSVCR